MDAIVAINSRGKFCLRTDDDNRKDPTLMDQFASAVFEWEDRTGKGAGGFESVEALEAFANFAGIRVIRTLNGRGFPSAN